MIERKSEETPTDTSHTDAGISYFDASAPVYDSGVKDNGKPVIDVEVPDTGFTEYADLYNLKDFSLSIDRGRLFF